MHLLQTQERSLDEEAPAVDLAHSPAELVVLSFTDSDLGVAAAAHAAEGDSLPGLRLVQLARLKHPYSVDLFVAKLARKTRVVLVRLLGGLDYWRYGVDELAAAARHHGFALAVVPGDDRDDPRLVEASTLPPADLHRLWLCFQDGGAHNVAQALRLMAARAGFGSTWDESVPVPAAGVFQGGCRPGPADVPQQSAFGPTTYESCASPRGGEGAVADRRDDGPRSETAGAPHALILFYRSVLLAGDTAPITALADELAARGARVTSLYANSLKDPDAQAVLADAFAQDPPSVILNTTVFSARGPAGGAVTDRTGVPVLQVMLSGATREQWLASARGLGAADLAMNVVLPEVDGRIIAGVLSFKAEAEHRADLDFTPLVHRPEPDRVAHAADLALAWARLGRASRRDRRIACILSDYPGRCGRTGYAVGLDTPASAARIADHLRAAGFGIDALPEPAALMRQLTAGEPTPVLSLADYRAGLATLPAAFVADVQDAWGEPDADPGLVDGRFAFRFHRAGHLILAVQPDRGTAADRRTDYHDAALPPRHAYVAFYLWLRTVEQIHALMHLGTHGTLEWLPGKAVALDAASAPEAVLGPVPVIYPFIVNNPGEAAQAKRRIAAVTIGHLTPPLRAAGQHGAALDLETLLDEYAQAAALDPRRARILVAAIRDRARDTGIDRDSGMDASADPDEALARLDAWLCDLKEMRIGDGLHVFGEVPDPGRYDEDLGPEASGTRAACGPAELGGLLRALDGRFVPPGPAGMPARARTDVLPTGRNLFTVDPRAIPTRTAYDLGLRLADAVMTRHAQDHGDWPRRLVLDLWGSATMRTGGEDLGQAFALMGVRPRWDGGSGRVLGYDIQPRARMDWPRVDVTLRISGLFRDTFPDQIALFDAASRAVAALDEDDDDNALAASNRAEGTLAPRVFGGAPGRYGVGLGRASAAPDGRAASGEIYLAATSHAYGTGEGRAAPEAFRARVVAAEAYLHVQDLPGTDLLDASTYADHEGGFAAAAALLGAAPALYHADATVPGRAVVRTLGEEVARVVRGRATNPRWIAGQMRHGYRGAAEIAETVDNLCAFAATTDVVPSHHFDLLFDATCGDDAVRSFLVEANPAAARAIAVRFTQALDRGHWISRRNSTAAILADMALAA